MVEDKEKTSSPVKKSQLWMIIGLHKKRGFVNGVIDFPDENAAHKHWDGIEQNGMREKRGFTKTYFVMPK